MHDLSTLPPMPVVRAHRNPSDIKRRLGIKGWPQRDAAKEIGVTFEHLNRVLNGHRESSRLLDKLEALPNRKEAACLS